MLQEFFNTPFLGALSVAPKRPIVNCARNPFDLRPLADAAMEKVNRLVDGTTPENPLIIFMGEQHKRPTNRMAAQMLLSRLIKEYPGEISFATELEHNMLAKIFDLCAFAPHHLCPPCIHGNPIDPTGQVTLRFLAGERPFTFAESPVSMTNLFHFLLENRIPTGFCDISKSPNGRIDYSHPLTSAILEQNGIEPNAHHQDPSSRPGMTARNIVSWELALAHARRSKSRICVYLGGQHHIFGFNRYYPLETSLYGLSRLSPCPILTLMHGQRASMLNLRGDARDAAFKGIVTDGLAENEYVAGQEAEERVFVDGVAKHSGGEIRLHRSLPPVDYTTFRRTAPVSRSIQFA